ncbi:hypothetical protein MKX01_016490 [Papaver californicum]|nr:hypothetical protein MKX01_016490 [Papaver californicum]
MTTQISTFKQYIVDGVYNKHGLDESMAIVSSSGSDYTGYQGFVGKFIYQLELSLREIKKIGVKKVVVMLTMQPLGMSSLHKAKTLSYEKCDKPLTNFCNCR